MLRLALCALLAVGSASLAHAEDWGVTRDPFDRGVIAQYKAALATSPHDGRALAQLTSLYRRYRSVERLAEEYRAAHPTWAALVVLGTIERSLRDERALSRFERAVIEKPDDAAAWRVIGELRVAAGKRIAARAAYERALQLATPALEVRAVRDLIAFVQTSGDHEAEEMYFTRLVELTPRDARAWIDRGDAMLASSRFELARVSYAMAEPLLATDPERRVEVIARGAMARERLGSASAAMDELRRALAMLPRTSYLTREIVGQMIENRRRAQALPAVIAELEALWPERTRQHYEWTTLAALYEQTRRIADAIAAYRAAVKRSPSETMTAMKLISLLDRAGDPQQALEHLEAAARIAPRDVALQLALAQRYGRFDDRAFSTLVALAKRHARNRDALLEIAELYVTWERPDLAEEELAHAVRLTAATRDAKELSDLGRRALDLGAFRAARAAYTAASRLAPADPANFTGLAYAADGLREWDSALQHAEHVLYLVPDDVAHRAQRRAARKDVVQILLRTQDFDPAYVTAYHQLWAWSFLQDNDVEAGYFLAAYYTASPRGDQPFETLTKLARLVPDDEAVAADLDRAESVGRDARWRDRMYAQYLQTERLAARQRDPEPDRLEGARIGVHFGAGAGMRGDMPLTLDLGASVGLRARGELTLLSRLDWTRRVGDRDSAHGIAASAGVLAHVLTTPQVALLVGGAQRVERRFGELMRLARTDVATEVLGSLVLRDAPFAASLRFEAWYSGDVVALLELGFEIR